MTINSAVLLVVALFIFILFAVKGGRDLEEDAALPLATIPAILEN